MSETRGGKAKQWCIIRRKDFGAPEDSLQWKGGRRKRRGEKEVRPLG